FNMKVQEHVQKKSMTILAFVTLLSILLTSCAFGATAVKPTPTPKRTPTPTPSPTFTPTPTPDPTPTYPAMVPPAKVLGIAEDTQKPFTGIPWIRLGYATCFNKAMKGDLLKKTVARYQSQG